LLHCLSPGSIEVGTETGVDRSNLNESVMSYLMQYINTFWPDSSGCCLLLLLLLLLLSQNTPVQD
jgi:hypothetical protein